MVRYLIVALSLAITNFASPRAVAADVTLVTEFFAPYQYKTEDQRPAGVAVDLVDAILSHAKIDAAPQFLPWARAYKTAEKKENILIFSMVRTQQREATFHWVAALLVSRPGVLIHARSNAPPEPKTIDDLRRTRVCATPSTPFFQKLVKLGFIPGKNLIEFQTLFPDRPRADHLQLFESHCDFRVTNWHPFIALARARGIEDPEKTFAYYDAPDHIFGRKMDLYLAASKAFDAETLQAIRRSYDALRTSGELYRICHQRHNQDAQTCSFLAPA